MENGQEQSYEVVDNSSALSAIVGAEFDMQIATAKRFPRSIKKFQAKATELATLDEATAASCFYAVPRAGKTIKGESIRLAEIAIHAWGNARAGARVTEVGQTHGTVQATAIDLEQNVAVCIEKRFRITNSAGQRYNDDMITVTCNANAARAFRDAVFKIVPRSLLKPVTDAARQVAVGNLKSLGDRRGKALEWFAKIGATQEIILKKLKRAGIQEIDLDDLELLTGLKTAIKEGEITVENAFKDEEPTDPTTDVSAAQAKLAAKKAELKKKPQTVETKLDDAADAVLHSDGTELLWSYKIQGETSPMRGQSLGEIRAAAQLDIRTDIDGFTEEDKSMWMKALNEPEDTGKDVA